MNTKRLLISVASSLGLLLVLSLLTFTRATPPVLARPLSDTHVGGVINMDTTWYYTGTPYILDSNVTVAAGASLTIQPGVTVLGSTNIEVKVQGHLEALGTPTQPITFTDNGSGYWSGLIFDGNSGDGTGHLHNVNVNNGQNGTSVGYNPFNILALNVLNGQLLIEDSQIQNGYRGLYIVNSHVAVSHTLFHDSHGYYPLEVAGASSVMTLTGNSFINNSANRVLLQPDAMMSADTRLTRQTVLEGYQLADDFTVPAGITLTVEPGVTVFGNLNIELKVQGHLEALGTPTQPITFTDYDYGQWSGLIFDGNSGDGTGHLRNVTVNDGENGTSVGYNPFNILALNVLNGQLLIEDSQIQNGSRGLYIVNSHVAVSHTLFHDSHGYYPLEVTGASSVMTLTGNSFINNSANRVLLQPGAMMGANTRLTPQTVLEGYQLADDFTVPAGITLTVEPGVTVFGNLNIELKVQGHLEALGTPTQPITFTDYDYGQWSGLIFDGNSGDGTGHLRNVTVNDGENGTTVGYNPFNILALNVLNGQLLIEDSQIQNGSRGLYIVNSHVAVSHTLFHDSHGYYPLEVTGASSVMTLTGNSFINNSANRVLLQPGAMMGANTRLTRQTVLEGYQLPDDFTVPAGITLTVEPGVTVFGNTNIELKVQGHLEALGTPTQPITFTDYNTGYWTGLIFDGSSGDGTGHLRNVTVNNGQNGSSVGYNPFAVLALGVTTGTVTIEDSRIQNGLRGLYVVNSHVAVSHTLFTGFTDSFWWPIQVDGANSLLNLNRSVLQGNANGVRVNARNSTLTNNVLLDNTSTTLYVGTGARADLRHTTFARNGGEAVHVENGGTAVLTNTIIANHSTGVNAVSGSSVTLTHTLWDNNATPTLGAVSATGNITGPAVFAADGYHLTRYSFAIDQGVNAGVTDDIDGQPRPLPAGAAPDLGADEYPYSPGQEFVAEKLALPPQMLPPDSSTGIPYWRLRQPYLIRYYYGSPDLNPPDLALAITDTLPTGLALESQTAYPPLSFQQQGNTLKWNSPALHSRQSGVIQLMGVYTTPQAGRVLTNQAELQAGMFHFNLLATSSVPLIAPLITSPGNGELCAGSVHIKGTAQPGVTVTVYVNGSSYASPQPDASGLFTTTYSYAGNGSVTIKAKACLSDDQCSADSNPITLTAPQSFWCPQRSSWEGTPTVGPLAGKHLTYQFRDNTGNFSTQNWIIPGVYGFWNTTLHLRACNCPGGSQPSSVWVIADGTHYDPTGSYPQYDFAITGGAHNVVFWAQCGTNQISSLGQILIDPDGYVFDVTRGFDPISPTLHTVQGVTVTAYVSMPEWGGWIPWPAQLYNNQVNPQVTGSNGYFAFFTPPGSYYLQAEGANGYQAWRSPVIDVITQVVHVNIPLTPWLAGSFPQVTLTAGGLSPAIITVPVHSAVQWVSELNNLTSPAELARLSENPMLRLLSARNPLSDTLGFDGGMLSPGQAYRRQFNQPGTFTYSDGVGHTAQVVVTNYRIYLPLVIKSH